MRSAPKTDIVNDCFCSMVDNDPLITTRKAKVKITATRGVPVSQQLVRVVLKTLGYSRKKGSWFIHSQLPWESKLLQVSCNSVIGMKQGNLGLFSQWMRLASGKMVEAYTGIRADRTRCMYDRARRERGHDHTFYLKCMHLATSVLLVDKAHTTAATTLLNH
jgi:hypothetical protein